MSADGAGGLAPALRPAAGALRTVGRGALDGLSQLGGMALVAARALRALPRLDRRELLHALAHFGYHSLPLITATALFTGGILVLVADVNVQRFGARSVIGWAAGYTVLREFGPLLAALVLTGRVGARNAAELASMTLGRQIEGLRGVGVDPFALLVAPRVVASAVAIGALGIVANLVAVLSAAFFGRVILGVDFGMFFRGFSALLGWGDLVAGVIKTVVFGALIAVVSTRLGLAARGGAQAVGRVAALSVVVNAALLTAIDWVLTVALEGVR